MGAVVLSDQRAFRPAIAGAASGLVTAAMVAPLDVVKIRLQNQYFSHDVQPKYKGTFPTLSKIWTEEGVHGLFSGLAPSVYAYLPDRIIWFSVYHGGKKFFANTLGTSPEGTTTVHLLATLTASMASAMGTSPLWVVRTRLMTQYTEGPHGFKYKNASHAFRNMISKEGYFSLYKGLGPSLLGVSHSMVMFPLYEKMKYTMKERKYGINPDGTLSNLSILTASSIAKCVASLLTYPHEVIRTRLQTQKTFLVDQSPDMGVARAPQPKYQGVLQTVKVLVAEEGYMSLYRGLTTSIIRQVPAGAISLWMYELVLKW
ncbi:hypothetical protein CcCBS67573_g02865 [Chytriomyces confervae]|uniref:Uncharacterized protein n=1 Tax=Chytriomyces confervae TaxID=246404 RepID=A0A507FHU6_9FUNG|nr:hypothetical protein CcCBS67573_g02865 [Chytriomyces confervae]